MSEKEVEEIFDRLVNEQTGEIPWSSFLYASFDNTMLNKKALLSVFKYLNTDKEKEISFESLKKTFMRRGHNFQTEDQIDKMLIDAGIKPFYLDNEEDMLNQLTNINISLNPS